MPHVDFRGRDWEVEPTIKRGHKGGRVGPRVLEGTAVELAHENVAVQLFRHAYVAQDGLVKTFTCECDPVKAMDKRH